MKRLFLIFTAFVIFLLIIYVSIQTGSPALVITNTDPKSGKTHNPFLPITITFNREPKKNEVSVHITPETDISISILNNTLQIVPKESFLPITEYEVTINTQPPSSLRFTTEQTGSNPPGWNEEFNEVQQQYKQTHNTQDQALYEIRKTAPIRENGFTVEYTYKNNTYTIILSAPYEQNKNSFLNWFQSKGVTDLTTVRLEYKQQ